MGADLYIVPLRRTKEREEFYMVWTLEQLENAKYYEGLREEFEDDIEFYIDISDEGTLEQLKQENHREKLSKYWSGFYWLAIRNLLGERHDYEYAKVQFHKEEEILKELEIKAQSNSERLHVLMRQSACRVVKHKMHYIFNEVIYLRILQKYKDLGLEEEFVESLGGVYLCGDRVFEVLDILDYRGYARILCPVEREQIIHLHEELKADTLKALGLCSVDYLDFENNMWFLSYSV